MKRFFTRAQQMTVIDGMLAFVSILLVLQLWLLTATMESYLGGDYSVILPAAVVSGLCLALNLGLLYQLKKMTERL